MRLLVSGYGKKGEENIMLCDGNGSKIWSDTPEEVSYVISAGDRMFCVSEISTHSVIYSYVKDGEGYRFVDSVRFDGTNLCHICYSDKNRMVFGACWGSGDLVYASIDEEGRFISSGSIAQKNETDDDSLISRVHFVSVDRKENILMANNVGLDIIYFYEIRDGGLYECDRIYTERGQHPRHSVMTKDERTLYVITELSNEILVYDMDTKTLIQTISTLPHGFEGKSHCSAICISPDEKTVYGANRYSESIVFYSVGEDRRLSEAMRVNCSGEKPRHMALCDGGRALVIAYQSSSEICVMELDALGLPTGKETRFTMHDAAGVCDAI